MLVSDHLAVFMKSLQTCLRPYCSALLIECLALATDGLEQQLFLMASYHDARGKEKKKKTFVFFQACLPSHCSCLPLEEAQSAYSVTKEITSLLCLEII